jgi:hypothetical protein
MFQDIVDELQFFPLVFNFHICGFDIYGTLVARINRIHTGLPVFPRSSKLMFSKKFPHTSHMPGQLWPLSIKGNCEYTE